ncbi:MAG TPA: HDOD domain-containing protein [Candidatus Eisenbacteria bacterium]|nr:HDOD domain-containing protein [Candidatus Eisenbacteria bacterium]
MHEKFIARQPIFDKRLRVHAYELLFRSGPQNFFQPRKHASAGMIADSITLFDLQTLTGSARAFINIDEMALRLGAPRLLPPDRIVVEILENVKPTSEIVNLCRELRQDGYLLALDDFLGDPALQPLVQLAHYLKVDFTLLDADGRKRVAGQYSGNGVALLAEKVETQRDLDEARSLGYSYFQGYFFCKPSMLETRDIPGNKLIQLQLISAVAAPDLNYDAIENLLKQEPSLLYRLLRYLNSPALGLRAEVHSIRHAITLLGENEFRRWVSIFAVVAMTSGKPPELIHTALTRAYFCEEFSASTGLRGEGPNLFLMGLLSVSDALLDKPIRDVLNSLPIDSDIKSALCGGENRYRDLYEVLLALERAEWPKLSAFTQRLGCPEDTVPDSYQSALQKASAIST